MFVCVAGLTECRSQRDVEFDLAGRGDDWFAVEHHFECLCVSHEFCDVPHAVECDDKRDVVDVRDRVRTSYRLRQSSSGRRVARHPQ